MDAKFQSDSTHMPGLGKAGYLGHVEIKTKAKVLIWQSMFLNWVSYW